MCKAYYGNPWSVLRLVNLLEEVLFYLSELQSYLSIFIKIRKFHNFFCRCRKVGKINFSLIIAVVCGEHLIIKHAAVIINLLKYLMNKHLISRHKEIIKTFHKFKNSIWQFDLEHQSSGCLLWVIVRLFQGFCIQLFATIVGCLFDSRSSAIVKEIFYFALLLYGQTLNWEVYCQQFDRLE